MNIAVIFLHLRRSVRQRVTSLRAIHPMGIYRRWDKSQLVRFRRFEVLLQGPQMAEAV